MRRIIFILTTVLFTPTIWAQETSVLISEEHKVCKAADDCALVDPSCSACGPMDTVAKKDVEWFNQTRIQLCANYNAGVCDSEFDPRVPECKKNPGAETGLCVLIAPPEAQSRLIK